MLQNDKTLCECVYVCVYPCECVTLEREVKGHHYNRVGLRHCTLMLSCMFQAVLRVHAGGCHSVCEDALAAPKHSLRLNSPPAFLSHMTSSNQ